MRAVIQAVSSASVRVNGGEPRPIGPGLVILLGVKDTDTLDIVPKLAEKCAGLRIFKDENDKLNLSAKDLGYSALVVSQFTLYGDARKGRRPSWSAAAPGPVSEPLFESSTAALRALGEIVHDLDIADARFERPETPGVSALIAGICAGTDDDEERIARGSTALDGFYAHFTRRKED